MNKGITHHTFKAGALTIKVEFSVVSEIYRINYGDTVKTILAAPRINSIIELEKRVLKELISDLKHSIYALKPELEQREKASTTATNNEVTP